MIDGMESMSLLILGFWIIRNLYFLIMSLFLVDGRDGDEEEVVVSDAEMAIIKKDDSKMYEGITTRLTPHGIKVYLDEAADIQIGDKVEVSVCHNDLEAELGCVITGILKLKRADSVIYSLEILDYKEGDGNYLQVLFDRVPSLPQTLTRDYGIITHLLKNIAHRLIR